MYESLLDHDAGTALPVWNSLVQPIEPQLHQPGCSVQQALFGHVVYRQCLAQLI